MSRGIDLFCPCVLISSKLVFISSSRNGVAFLEHEVDIGLLCLLESYDLSDSFPDRDGAVTVI